jgi:hypothetical protein
MTTLQSQSKRSLEAADTAGWLGGPSAVSVGAGDSLIVNDSESVVYEAVVFVLR